VGSNGSEALELQVVDEKRDELDVIVDDEDGARMLEHNRPENGGLKRDLEQWNDPC
jgi:hypothetical protein